jgi:hypothetical protein
MPKAVDEALERDERERERRLSELELDANGSLGLLQSIYRSPTMPLSVRMRAAIEALPFEHPKLSVIASLNGGDFADRLEKAFTRSGKVIEVEPTRPKTIVPDR